MPQAILVLSVKFVIVLVEYAKNSHEIKFLDWYQDLKIEQCNSLKLSISISGAENLAEINR